MKMSKVWPVKRMELGKGATGVWENIKALMRSDEVFVQRCAADDDKSGYIYISSYDGKNRTLIHILERYDLHALRLFAKKGELLLMW